MAGNTIFLELEQCVRVCLPILLVLTPTTNNQPPTIPCPEEEFYDPTAILLLLQL
jgi:hypothetical protein